MRSRAGVLCVVRQGMTTSRSQSYGEEEKRSMSRANPLRALGYGSTRPSSALNRLDIAHGYVFDGPPRIWPCRARNAARPTSPTGF